MVRHRKQHPRAPAVCTLSGATRYGVVRTGSNHLAWDAEALNLVNKKGDPMRAVFQYPFPVTERQVAGNTVLSARAAVELIRAGDTLATGGFVGVGFAEQVAIALEERFFDANA